MVANTKAVQRKLDGLCIEEAYLLSGKHSILCNRQPFNCVVTRLYILKSLWVRNQRRGGSSLPVSCAGAAARPKRRRSLITSRFVSATGCQRFSSAAVIPGPHPYSVYRRKSSRNSGVSSGASSVCMKGHLRSFFVVTVFVVLIGFDGGFSCLCLHQLPRGVIHIGRDHYLVHMTVGDVAGLLK